MFSLFLFISFCTFNSQSLIINATKIDVVRLNLSWEYGGSWSQTKISCFSTEQLNFTNNCSTLIFHSSKRFAIYHLVPTYNYRFTVDLMRDNEEQPFISNTTAVIHMDLSPIEIFSFVANNDRIDLEYGFSPTGRWYTYVEINVKSKPSSMTDDITEQKLVDELCNRNRCKNQAHLIIDFASGHQYNTTVYASKNVSNIIRKSKMDSFIATKPPKAIQNLEAKPTSKPRQIEVSWSWPSIGHWLTYRVRCQSDENGRCSDQTFPFDSERIDRNERHKHLIGHLVQGSRYDISVDLLTYDDVSSKSLSTSVFIAPGSIRDLSLHKMDGKTVKLKWKWPDNSFFTHYTVKCYEESIEDNSKVPISLYEVTKKEIDQTTEYEHIVKDLHGGKTYYFEVNVESGGTPSKSPKKSSKIKIELHPSSDSTWNSTNVVTILVSVLLSLVLCAVITSIVFCIKRGKRKQRVLQSPETEKKSKRKERNLSNKIKSWNSFMSAPGLDLNMAQLGNQYNFSDQDKYYSEPSNKAIQEVKDLQMRNGGQLKDVRADEDDYTTLITYSKEIKKTSEAQNKQKNDQDKRSEKTSVYSKDDSNLSFSTYYPLQCEKKSEKSRTATEEYSSLHKYPAQRYPTDSSPPVYDREYEHLQRNDLLTGYYSTAYPIAEQKCSNPQPNNAKLVKKKKRKIVIESNVNSK